MRCLGASSPSLFTVNIYPQMNQMTQAEVGLCYPEDGIYQAIAGSAAASLRHLPPNMIIRNAIIDQVNVAEALKAATIVATSWHPLTATADGSRSDGA